MRCLHTLFNRLALLLLLSAIHASPVYGKDADVCFAPEAHTLVGPLIERALAEAGPDFRMRSASLNGARLALVVAGANREYTLSGDLRRQAGEVVVAFTHPDNMPPTLLKAFAAFSQPLPQAAWRSCKIRPHAPEDRAPPSISYAWGRAVFVLHLLVFACFAFWLVFASLDPAPRRSR